MSRARIGTLVTGALPVLAFPRAGVDWLAWVALVPGMLMLRAAASGREATVRGWWFGAGFVLAALYWLTPDVGPGLLLMAVVFGLLWALWGYVVWALVRPGRVLAAVVAVPSGWISIEWVRSWHMLGGPWALYGASQWRHPAVLGLAAIGGVWLVGLLLVGVNTVVAGALVARSPATLLLAVPVVVAIALVAPAASAAGTGPAQRPIRVALVQPGVVSGPAARFAAEERITSGLAPADLVVWGESSVGYDLSRRPDLVARLTTLARAHGPLLVNEDARDAGGRISKSSLLIGAEGIQGRYVKTRLVPFGEYIPLRSALGWLADVSRAAGQNRAAGTGVRALRAGNVEFGPLICFESTFPDLGRAVVHHGARLIVYQSSTSTFQGSWAPPQHASLGAVRAAETGRPVVQAALTGVSAAYDATGHRLAWLDTNRRGAVTIELRLADRTTPYDRFGDWAPWLAILVSTVAGVAWIAARSDWCEWGR